MRFRTTCLIGLLAAFLSALVAWPGLLGQNQVPPATPQPIPNPNNPAAVEAANRERAQNLARLSEKRGGPDLSQMKPLAQQMYRSAQTGADWLFRANRPDGRFDYGYLPALQAKAEGDHYLRQVGAAFTLARAARYFGDERHTAVARQAVLALLLDTTTKTAEGTKITVRHTTLPSALVNRLGAAGLLILAINELPAPADELLSQSEELCAYIRNQQQADGSLRLYDEDAKPAPSVQELDGINQYAGVALYGLMRSQQHRPAAWKTEVVRKALAYYRPWWKKNQNPAFVPWQTAAHAEAYLATGEQGFADFVNEMSDWLLTLQYAQLDPRHPLWAGGFMSWMDGKPVAAAPEIGSAVYAGALAEACRVARKAGDLPRYQRYRDGVERCLQFTVTLQYTEANTQHFADWYRRRLVGGFHASHQDGNLRIDYAQHAVGAMVQYLQYASAE